MNETIKLTCSDCNNDFRWLPNSTIKPKRCTRCQNLLDFQKKKDSADRIALNKSILSGASMYAKNKRTGTQMVFHTERDGKGIKKAKKRLTWDKLPLPKLIKYVQDQFCNPYIRLRDATLYGKCISCNGMITQAGHRYSVGDFPGMRLLVNNIHGQEISCNHFKSGNIDAYDRGLINRHGLAYLTELKECATLYLRGGFKFDRHDVIEIGLTYKYLFQERIWVFSQKEFNEIRNNLKQLTK